MGKLSDILGEGNDGFRGKWDSTAAAGDFEPLPPGDYVARIVKGELANAKTGTPCYKIEFEVFEGEYAGRKVWHDIWLSDSALSLAKRDLAKIGIERPEQLEQPVPKGIRCKLFVALRKDDDGQQFNRVRRFDVIGIDQPVPDDFASEGDAPF